MTTGQVVRYTYRLRVSPAQERRLLAEWDAVRWVWNQCVSASRAAHAASTPEARVTCGPAELDKRLTGWRAEHAWLGERASVPQQQVIRLFAAARAKALAGIKDRVPLRRRRGMPKFKAKHRALPSLAYTVRGFSLPTDPTTGRVQLRLAGGIVVRPVWSRDLPSAPSSVTVYRDAVGDWWCSFVVRREVEILPAVRRAIGVDWGVSEIATTTSDAHDYAHPQRRRSAQHRLTHYQRMMARRKPAPGRPTSRRYREAKREVAKVHRQVARQRKDDAAKWAKSVVSDFDQIAVEDFHPNFLAQTTMAKRAADGAIAAAKSALLAMAAKHGRDLLLVDPRYTSMDCSNCGARAKHRPSLSERTYTCWSCGVILPRDKNSAALMVVRAGFVPAGAEGTSPVPQLAASAA